MGNRLTYQQAIALADFLDPENPDAVPGPAQTECDMGWYDGELLVWLPINEDGSKGAPIDGCWLWRDGTWATYKESDGNAGN